MKFFLWVACFLLFFNSQAQTIINGQLTNTEGHPISYANIILKDKTGKSLAYTFSDDEGHYSLKVQEEGLLYLSFSSLGYETWTTEIEISGDGTLSQDAVLQKAFSELDEVILEAERPIRVKKDTLVFDAKAFAQGNEEVLEDLLKKIPGLSVDSNGTIKVSGREVEKVMVEGDDFFGQGYKILTKNMPPQPLDEVEVLHNYSHNRLLKGVEESDRVALNLTLEEEAKRFWFGNLKAGYGPASEDRYHVRGNLMNFGEKNKYYFLGNLNNTGYDATGDISRLIRPQRTDEPESIGDDQQLPILINWSFYQPNFKRERTNFNNSELFSLNAIFNPHEKLKIKTLGFFHGDEKDFFRSRIESFSASQTDFINREDFKARRKEHTGFGQLDLQYDISSTSSLKTISKYNRGSTSGFSDLVFNGISTLQELESDGVLFDQKISYTNKFRDNNAFLLTGRFISEKAPQQYHVNRFFYEDLFRGSENANNVGQANQQQMQFAGFEAHLLDRRENENLLEIRLGNQFRRDELNSTFEIREDGKALQLPEGFQNRTRYATNNLYLKMKYHWVLGNFDLTGKLDLHQVWNQLEYENFDETENLFFVNPSLGLEWKIDDKNKLRSSYSFNTKNAGILEVYDAFVLTGFRTFQAGTGSFNQLDASNFSLSYEIGEWSDRFFANIFLVYTKNHDFFSSRSMVEPNYSLSERMLFKDRELFSINASLDRYLKFIRSNLKLKLGHFQTDYQNIVNNSRVREIFSKNYTYGFELRSGFLGFFDYHLGTEWTRSGIRTGDFSDEFMNNVSFLDLYFDLSDRFDIELQGERYYFGNLQVDPTYYFLDFDASYTLKPNKLTLSLEGRNLFNTRTFRNFSVSDLGTSTTSYRLLPRFALLSLEYRF